MTLARTLPARVVTWIGLFLALAAPAAAQFGMGGMDFAGLAGMSRVRRSELRTFGSILSLDPEQAKAAEGLYEGYAQASRDLTRELETKMRTVQEKMQDSGDIRAMTLDMAKAGKEFNEKNSAMEKGLMDDLRALLTPEQDARWARVERARRRSAGMRMGIVAGHNVDLLDIVADIGADRDPSPELADTLGRYELEIDRGIQVFKKMEAEQQKQADNLEDMFDPARMQELMQKSMAMLKDASQTAKSMRDVNRQYARLLGPLLPEEHRARFDEEFKRRSFPRVYRASPVIRALDAAAKFDDLTAEQRAAIGEIRDGYARDAEPINARWAAAIDDRDEKTGGPMMAMMSGIMGGAGGGTEVSEASEARRKVDERYTEKLRAVLNEAQRARLPEEKRDPNEGFEMMGMIIEPDEDEPPPSER